MVFVLNKSDLYQNDQEVYLCILFVLIVDFTLDVLLVNLLNLLELLNHLSARP